MNAARLTGKSTEVTLTVVDGAYELHLVADGYEWAGGYLCRRGGAAAPLQYESHAVTPTEAGSTIEIAGRVGQLRVRQVLRLDAREPLVEESLTVTNDSAAALALAPFHCGFTTQLQQDSGLGRSELDALRVTAYPFRRDMRDPHGRYQEFTPRELLSGRGGYRVDWRGDVPLIPTEEWGAEGWVWWGAADDRGMLTLKHAPDALEFALIQPLVRPRPTPVKRPGDLRLMLLFGGAGLWHDDPEEACVLAAGQSHTFGTTYYRFFRGDWRTGYYLARGIMQRLGHDLPQGYDPPVHWNELYDNPLWWVDWAGQFGGDEEAARRQHYTLDGMMEEAAKARELGCEALYLDPGWDTRMGSTIWADDRLGPMERFVADLRDKYGLRLALHTTFADWHDPASFSPDARVLGPDGKPFEIALPDGRRVPKLCGAARQFREEKIRRLKALAARGVAFFMVDGTWFTGDCHATNHGHPVPCRRTDHCESIRQLIAAIRQEFPDVLIELHDPVLSGDLRYSPCHYLHGPGAHQELWACEFMWEPLDDLLTGRAISLYYYNLAYRVPLYLHIDLRHDNTGALAFWWYASTCRHLGVGGKRPAPEVWTIHQQALRRSFRPLLKPTFTGLTADDPLPPPELWEAHKAAMRRYRELKAYFVAGEFYGLDELAHVHSLGARGMVFALFNLETQPRRVELEFGPQDVGLAGAYRLKAKRGAGYALRERGAGYLLEATLPARSPLVVDAGVRRARSG
jgi:hypothetical protein